MRSCGSPTRLNNASVTNPAPALDRNQKPFRPEHNGSVFHPAHHTTFRGCNNVMDLLGPSAIPKLILRINLAEICCPELSTSFLRLHFSSFVLLHNLALHVFLFQNLCALSLLTSFPPISPFQTDTQSPYATPTLHANSLLLLPPTPTPTNPKLHQTTPRHTTPPPDTTPHNTQQTIHTTHHTSHLCDCVCSLFRLFLFGKRSGKWAGEKCVKVCPLCCLSSCRVSSLPCPPIVSSLFPSVSQAPCVISKRPVLKSAGVLKITKREDKTHHAPPTTLMCFCFRFCVCDVVGCWAVGQRATVKRTFNYKNISKCKFAENY